MRKDELQVVYTVHDGDPKEIKGVWTQFIDMHSGGGRKLNADYIYIEATEDEAVELFEEIFGRHPYGVTCECCGDDYLISEETEGEFEDRCIIVTKADINRLRMIY